MADAVNPYAPPTAEVDAPHAAGEVYRDGKLLRMDRNATLPSRCVACNAPAPRRVDRTLYWSPFGWRLAAWGIPVLLALLAFANGVVATFAMTAFWPAVILLAIVNVIVRRKLDLEIPLCIRHGRVRSATTWAIWGAIVSALALFFAVASDLNRIPGDRVGSVGLGLVLVMGIAGLVRTFSAADRVALQRLDAQRAWLKRTGAPFRASFPETPEPPSTP